MPSFRYIRYLLLSAVLVAGALEGRAQDGPLQQATLQDGQKRSGTLGRTSTGQFIFESGDASLPARRLMRVEFPQPARPRDAAEPFRVYLWGGDQLAVEQVRLEKQTAWLVLPDQSHVQLDRSALAAVSAGSGDNRGRAGGRRFGVAQDQLELVEGDDLFGQVVALDQTGVSFQGAFPVLHIGWEQVRQIYLRRTSVQGGAVRGLMVRLHLQNTERAEDDDRLQGALVQCDDQRLVLDHPHLGRLNLPRSRLRLLEVFGEGLRIDVESAEFHLGNAVRPKLPLPIADGTELVRTFSLEALSAESAAVVVCNVVQLESAQAGGSFAKELQEGHLRTRIWINDQLVDYLNRYVTRPIDQPQPLRIPIPAGVLKRGTNRLRISQTPLSYDKTDFDDFLLANLAIEVTESLR